MCGVANVARLSNVGWISGSLFQVSTTACDSRPLCSAPISASSSTIFPRDVLMKIAPGLIASKKEAEAIRSVG